MTQIQCVEAGHSLEKLSRHLFDWSVNTRLQSSQLAEPLWTTPSLKKGTSVRQLISTSKKKKKRKKSAGGEWMVENSPKVL